MSTPPYRHLADVRTPGKITTEHGERRLERLEKTGKMVVAGSLCGLGNSAPNPVLSTIKYFREEYEEHVNDE